MKEQVDQKIKVLIEKAKAAKKDDVKNHQNRNSLAESINSKQQADNLKKLLKSL